MVDFDPLAQDLPVPEDGVPASMVPLEIESGGAVLNGVAYVPPGAGPHPGVVILHGFPGYERNLDLAQACRRAGWTAVVFHYRGAWGSGGSFSFGHVLEDARTAVAWLRSDDGRSDCRTDPGRIAMAGHSMGGWAALHTAADDPRILGAASIAGANMGAQASMALEDEAAGQAYREVLAASLSPLAGTDADRLVEEATAGRAAWDLLALAPRLVATPVLLVAGAFDRGVPPEVHHHPMVEAMRAAGATRMTDVVLDADHPFSDHRITLIRLVVEWLGGLLD